MKTVKRVRLKQVCDGRIRFAVDRISRPREVYDAVMPYYKGADREILSVLCLDAQNQPNSFNVASIGALNTALDAGFQTTVLPMIAGAVGRLAPMDVKLNGVMAKTNPSSGRYSIRFQTPRSETGCSPYSRSA